MDACVPDLDDCFKILTYDGGYGLGVLVDQAVKRWQGADCHRVSAARLLSVALLPKGSALQPFLLVDGDRRQAVLVELKNAGLQQEFPGIA